MPSITDIANAALSLVGTRSKIAAIDEGSTEANACRTHFAMARDATLRAFDWNFARRIATLAELPDPPVPVHRFAMPVDCLRLLHVIGKKAFQVTADLDPTGAPITVVLTGAAPAVAVYTARIADTGRWDAGFVDAMVRGLAARVCFELTGKSDREKALLVQWQQAVREAAAQALNERGR
jgi:hypothetical protein